MTFNEVLTGFDDILYTWLLIYMLAGAGIYFTVRSGFVQIRLFKEAFNCMFEKKAEGKDPVFCESDIGLDNTDVWKEEL